MQGIIKAIYFTCQFASVFPCNHNNPVPLNCDRCGSAGQISNICYCDNQDIAQCLERWGERVIMWENWLRSPLSTQAEKTFIFDSIHLSIILHTEQDQVYSSWQKKNHLCLPNKCSFICQFWPPEMPIQIREDKNSSISHASQSLFIN